MAPGADMRKACVLALVLAVHALLLTLRLPQRATARGLPSSAPINVRLLPPLAATQPGPTAVARPTIARPKRTAASPAVARPEPPAGRDPGAQAPEPRREEATAAPSQPRRGPVLPPPEVPAAAVAPTLAERARARSSEGPQEAPLQRGVARSLRPDCRQAYSGLVLLAIPALLRDSLRDDGCRW